MVMELFTCAVTYMIVIPLKELFTNFIITNDIFFPKFILNIMNCKFSSGDMIINFGSKI